MAEDRSRIGQIQRRIADALGTDVSRFFSDRHEPGRVHAVAELLTAFERIDDPDDRRACIEFVRSMAERERPK